MKYLGLILAVFAALIVSHVLAKGTTGQSVQVTRQAVVITRNGSPTDSGSSRSTRSIADKFHNFLENLRVTIREGNTTLGVPPLDPFYSDRIAIKLAEDLIKGTIEATNFDVTGLAGYTINNADFGILPPKMVVGLTWPQIFSAGSYKFNVTALNNIQAWGDGDYKVTLTDLSFVSTVSLKVTGGVSIKKMETSISLGALALSATGIFHDDDTSKILCEVISDMGPQLINDYQKELTSVINERVTTFVNNYLKGKSLGEIIAIIS